MKELEFALGLTTEKPTFRGKPLNNIQTFNLNSSISAKLTGESEDQKKLKNFYQKHLV